MLLNLSSNPKKTKKTIDEQVGKAFGLEARNKMGGTDSGKLVINSGSIDIYNLLALNQGLNTCNIELRPDGIIIRFQVMLENYGLIIPFYKLKMYKGKATEYSLHRDQYCVRIRADRQVVHDFMKKIREVKASHWTSDKYLP